MGRENELYRDKIEVSLDGRQIFSLFFAGAVIVCAVFVIGIIVGKRVEARAHVDRAGNAASGDPLAALDRLEADAPLSFRRTLRGDQAAGGSVDGEIAAMASAQKAAQGELAPAGKAGAAPVAAEHGQANKGDKSDKGDKGDKSDKLDDERAEAKPSAKADEKSEAKSDAKPDAKPEPKPDAKKDDARLAKGDEAPQKPDAKREAEPDAKSEAKPDAKKGDKKKSKYTLQLSAFQERGEAETFLSELRAAGYAPFVVPAEVEGKGTFYRVRLGNYPSYDDAVAAKADFERRINRIAYVTKL